MLIELFPANSKNGLVGKYKNEGGEKYFATIVVEGMAPEKVTALIQNVSEKIIRLRQADLKKFTSLSPTANTAFAAAEQVIFEPETEIKDVIHDRLNASTDTIFVCPDKVTYAETCAAIGITRADHLVTADLAALVDAKPSLEKSIIGNVHAVRDLLIQDRDQGAEFKKMALKMLKQSKSTEHREEMRKILLDEQIRDRFINQIPIATKFSLGTVTDSNAFMACPTHKPWLFRLPFKKCLFHIDGYTGPNGKKIENYLLASQMEGDDKIFRAEILSFDPTTREIHKHQFYLTWDISGEELKVGRHYYDEKQVDDIANEDNTRFMIVALLPFIAALNDMKSKLEVIHPPALPGVGPQKKLGASPYYDYHVLVPKPRSEGSVPAGEEHEPKRLHKRRGHYRTYVHDRFTNMKGQTRWIEEKIWGDETKGVLGKEYDLSGLDPGKSTSELGGAPPALT